MGATTLNPDDIAEHELGGWNDTDSIKQAADLYDTLATKKQETDRRSPKRFRLSTTPFATTYVYDSDFPSAFASVRVTSPSFMDPRRCFCIPSKKRGIRSPESRALKRTPLRATPAQG